MTGLKVAAAVLVVLATMLAAQMLLQPQREATAPATHGLPWQIETPAEGVSRVFGLTLGGPSASTLADARRAFPRNSALRCSRRRTPR